MSGVDCYSKEDTYKGDLMGKGTTSYQHSERVSCRKRIDAEHH